MEWCLATGSVGLSDSVDKKSSGAAPFKFSVIDAHTTDGAQETFFHNEIEALFLLNGILFRWLIQSQAQSGPTSAVTCNINPHRLFFFCFS
jgi:hypothetical protein